jgi:hypothetical protein
MRPPHHMRHTQPTVLHCQPSSLEARWRSWMPSRIWSLRGIRCASPTHESTRPWVSALCVPHSGPTHWSHWVQLGTVPRPVATELTNRKLRLAPTFCTKFINYLSTSTVAPHLFSLHIHLHTTPFFEVHSRGPILGNAMSVEKIYSKSTYSWDEAERTA